VYIRSTIGCKHAQMYITPNRKPSGHRDRGSDILRGPQSSPSDVCRHDNVRESETRPLGTSSPAGRRRRQIPGQNCHVQHCVWYNPQEEDNKFRDGFVTVTRNCYTLPRNGPVPVCNEYLGLEWCIYCLILLYSRQVL
jgi:hypothetical protein